MSCVLPYRFKDADSTLTSGPNFGGKRTFTEFIRLHDERNRKYKHIVNVSGEEEEPEEPISADSLIAYSDEYASVREHVIINFDSFIGDSRIGKMYIHNPPQILSNKITNLYPQTRIEAYEYDSINKHNIVDIHNNFDQRIIGQPKAQKAIAVAITPLCRETHSKPIVILLYGPSGVGKTESAKYLSEKLGGGLFRKQFSMFQNSEFITYLFGGHHHEKSFAKEVLERETNVILLDEFDKANSIFHSAFYQLFDEGIFEDKNYRVNLKNSIILCTSNYTSANEVQRHLGDPIFSRIDALVEFKPLSEASLKKILFNDIEREWAAFSQAEQNVLDKEETQARLLKHYSKIKNARRIKAIVREAFSDGILTHMLNTSKQQ